MTTMTAGRARTATAPVHQQPAEIRSLLLVRNAVDHDARVLRAARVAERACGGSALVLGVASATAPAGAAMVEGVPVLRLPARPPGLARLTGRLRRRADGDAHGQTQTATTATTAGGAVETPRLTTGARARRVLSGLSYSLQAVSVARRVRPTLVHANDWNTMWSGIAIKLVCRTRLVYDSHELWADRNGRWEWRPWLLAGEALFVRAADEVLTSSPGYADTLAARYRVPRPAVVRNIPERAGPAAEPIPTDPERMDAASSDVERADRAAKPARSDPALVVYVGGLMPGRGLEQMIDALALLPDVRLRAVGPGTPRYRMGLLSRAAAGGVGDRVELRAPVPPACVPDALAGAAAGLCLIQPVCRSYELCLPNKLFEYAAAGVPVLASDVPSIAALVRRHGLGEVAPARDPRAIAAGLERLLEPDRRALAAARAAEFARLHGWAQEAGALEGVYMRAGATR